MALEGNESPAMSPGFTSDCEMSEMKQGKHISCEAGKGS